MLGAQPIFLSPGRLCFVFKTHQATWLKCHQTVANFLCVFECREGEDIGLFITPVPKILYYRLLFVGLTTLGINNEFWLVVHIVECPNISTTNCKLQRGNLYIIIGDVHQLIGHCLIPIDAWFECATHAVICHIFCLLYMCCVYFMQYVLSREMNKDHIIIKGLEARPISTYNTK